MPDFEFFEMKFVEKKSLMFAILTKLITAVSQKYFFKIILINLSIFILY